MPHPLVPDGPEAVNADAWQAYAERHLRRGTAVPEAERIDWGFPGAGPDETLLGTRPSASAPSCTARAGCSWAATGGAPGSCSLTAWRPDPPIDHAPAPFTPYADRTASG
ncbi:hypothetical protein [Streptomyces sp. NPDC059894]|uniref:hypothetical protein n=1 Tax=unclassified Streptomyces TaxID=2593676 RepID=UPI00364E4371